MAINILRFLIPKSLVEYIYADSTVRQAIEKMNFHRYTAIPVLDRDGKYIATLRNDDIINYIFENGSFNIGEAENISVTEISDERYSKPLPHSASMSELIECVKEHNFVPVVDDRGCFIGLILRREVLGFLQQYLKDK